MNHKYMNLKIGYLYGDLMNIYGDTGNSIALKHRAHARNIDVEVKMITIGSSYKVGDVDMFFFGGGQDEYQIAVSRDLIKSKKGELIKEEIEKGIPLLAICGGYQLLGEYYQASRKQEVGSSQDIRLEGVSLFPAYTEAGDTRMIGNIAIESEWDKLIGFENHSGKTYLRPEGKALGTVLKGFGNNGEDGKEGCVYKNAIGCYMHGSLLPKNPQLCDWFIEKTLSIKYNKDIKLEKLNDFFEINARADFLAKIGI